MNIKSEEAHDLARALANTTGESLTKAVTIAIQERLERLKKDNSASMSRRLMAIGKDCAPRLRLVADHADLLYGADGLPK